MGWLKAFSGWGALGGVLGLLLVTIQETTDAAWFVVTLVFMCGLLGLFFHHRDHVNRLEDAALERAMRDPSSVPAAADWVARLRAGQRVKIGAWTTLTPDGIEWTGLRKKSIRWHQIEKVTPWSMEVRGGIRSARMVRLRVDDQLFGISCTKRKFDDVLATCTAMATVAASRGP